VQEIVVAPHCCSVPVATCSSGSGSNLSVGGTFRWHAEVDPDQLKYVIHGLLRLDAQLAAEVEDGRRPAAPDEGREFYLVLVRDLLFALEMEETGGAAFVDQLRCFWPSAAEAQLTPRW
jgi:hypothetical protein